MATHCGTTLRVVNAGSQERRPATRWAFAFHDAERRATLVDGPHDAERRATLHPFPVQIVA